MTSSHIDHPRKLKVLLAWYNMIPNLLWSTLNLMPVVIFCFTKIELSVIYIFLAISAVPLFFTNAVINRLRIGQTTRFYKKLGVHLINKVSQNGSIINTLLRKKFPRHRIINYDRQSITHLVDQTYVFEKFHWVLFLFFNLITCYCIYMGYYFWAFIIFFTNIAYNIYPVLLQQYIRLKLSLFNKIKAIKELPQR